MKKILFTGLILLCSAGLLLGQDVGEIALKSSGFGQKKMAKAPKKVYISEFNINYQLAYSQTSISRGGSELGGGFRGDAKATLSVAIPGIDLNKLQKITDDAYQDYVGQLEQAGFEIISADEAGKTDLLSNWERMEGGKMSQAQFPGYVASTPSGADYFVKRVTKKGRTKKGLFEYATKLSKQMEGAIVVKVNLVIPFVEEAEGAASKSLRRGIGGLAKVVLRPNFRLAKWEGIQLSKLNAINIWTKSGYWYMESMKNQGQLVHELKKDVEIGGVFENKKYKATQKADKNLWSNSNAYFTIFSYEDREIERTQPIPCDTDKYLSGLSTVVTGFVQNSLDGFLAVAKGK